MLGRTNTGGGSGAFGLQIVEGLVRPKNPTQGMIWAKTEHKVTYYDLSATKPENPIEGTLWLDIGDSGHRKIVSPISKEWITVYPLSAELYISGAWVSINAVSYQDGEWVEWFPAGALYWEGNELESITGGWVAEGKKYQSSSSTPAKKPELVFYDDYMYMSQTGVGAGIVYPVAKIDLTGYNRLVAEGEFYGTGTDNGNWTISIWKELGTYYAGEVAYQSIPTNKKITRVELDVSSVNEMCVIGFVLNSTGASSSGVGYNKVERLYLE